MKVYAFTPTLPKVLPLGVHLTANKAYEVLFELGNAFDIIDDKGMQIPCYWRGCAFAGGNCTRAQVVEPIEPLYHHSIDANGQRTKWIEGLSEKLVSTQHRPIAVRQHVKANADDKNQALDRVKLSNQHGPLGGFDRADGELLAALWNSAPAILANPILCDLQAEAWEPIDTAPFDTPVEIQAGHMTFWARLVPDASMTEDMEACSQWRAEYEGEHPPCWSDGACWSSNAHEVSSLQPTAWRIGAGRVT